MHLGTADQLYWVTLMLPIIPHRVEAQWGTMDYVFPLPGDFLLTHSSLLQPTGQCRSWAALCKGVGWCRSWGIPNALCLPAWDPCFTWRHRSMWVPVRRHRARRGTLHVSVHSESWAGALGAWGTWSYSGYTELGPSTPRRTYPGPRVTCTFSL